MRELRQRTIEKQSPNPVKEHIIQTDEKPGSDFIAV